MPFAVLLLFFAFAVLLLTVRSKFEPDYQSRQRIGWPVHPRVRFLEKELALIAPWPNGSTTYDITNWLHLVNLARYFQAAHVETATKVIENFQWTGITNGDFEGFTGLEQIQNDKKLFLLLRVIFDIPEKCRVENPTLIPVFGGWVVRGAINHDGTENLAWPIKWNDGKPFLVSGFEGMQGANARYKAVEEYKCFYSVYKMRDLSQFRY